MKQLQELLRSEQGKSIKQFLLSHYFELNKLSAVKELDNIEELAVELKAQRKACEILKNILSQIIDVENFKENIKAEEDKLFFE